MDPNQALRVAREALSSARILTDAATTMENAGEEPPAKLWEDVEYHRRTALDHYEALDEWISKGGFQPLEWARRAIDDATAHALTLAEVRDETKNFSDDTRFIPVRKREDD